MSARKYTVERDWITTAGFRAVVTMGALGHRCGYVGVPENHPLHGVEYIAASPALEFPAKEQIGKRGILAVICATPERLQSPEVVFDVHGGLTYSGGSAIYPALSAGLWWFGYDCGHYGDKASPEYLDQMRATYPDSPYMWRTDGEHRSLSYCIDECESLASQLVSRIRKPTWWWRLVRAWHAIRQYAAQLAREAQP